MSKFPVSEVGGEFFGPFIPHPLVPRAAMKIAERGQRASERLKEHIKRHEAVWIKQEEQVMRKRLAVADYGDKVGILVECEYNDRSIRQTATASVRSRSAMRLSQLNKTKNRMFQDALDRHSEANGQLKLDFGNAPTPKKTRRMGQ